MEYIIIQESVRGKHLAEGMSIEDCICDYINQMETAAKGDPELIEKLNKELAIMHDTNMGDIRIISTSHPLASFYYRP